MDIDYYLISINDNFVEYISLMYDGEGEIIKYNSYTINCVSK